MIRKTCQLGALVLAMCSMAAGTAGGSELSFEPGSWATLVSDGRVVFDSSLADFECHVDIEVHLHDPVTNAAGVVIGETWGTFFSECEGVEFVGTLSEPFDIRLSSAATSTSVDFLLGSFAIEFINVFAGLDCLYIGNPGFRSTPSAGVLWSVSSSANSMSRGSGQSVFCPSSIRMLGDFELSPDQTIALI